MITFKQATDALIASREWDSGNLGRFAFWVGVLGDKPLEKITPDDVHAGVVALRERGKLKGSRYKVVATGEGLAACTRNRYLSQCGQVFVFAQDEGLVKPSFISPTVGLRRAKEPPQDKNRYLRPEEVARLIALAPVIDKNWKKMQALIIVAYHSGMRVGSLMGLLGEDVDWKERTIVDPDTKNGEAVCAPLSDEAYEALKKLPRVAPKARVFGNRNGDAYCYRKLFNRLARVAHCEGKTFHFLRHGHGHALATAGTSQQMIMQSMGHKTLTASARYAHANVDDKRQVIGRVFNKAEALAPAPPPAPPTPPAPGERPRLALVKRAA